MKIGQTKILGLALLLGGLALGGVGFWLLLSPAQYRATAKIWVENDVGDFSNGYATNEIDPYFRQITFEIIQSQLVLSSVVTNLNLNTVWGDKYFHGSTLHTADSIKIINQHLRLAPVRHTKVIKITYFSDDPNEAAYLADAIADSYYNYRQGIRQEMSKKGLEVLQRQYQDEEKRISLLQTNNEQLVDIHKLLGKKIEEIKLDLEIPKTSIVRLIERAEPPQSPVGSNHPLGAALFAVGLFPLIGGILLLKPSRQPAV